MPAYKIHGDVKISRHSYIINYDKKAGNIDPGKYQPDQPTFGDHTKKKWIFLGRRNPKDSMAGRPGPGYYEPEPTNIQNRSRCAMFGLKEELVPYDGPNANTYVGKI